MAGDSLFGSDFVVETMDIDTDGNIQVERVQDVAPILDANKAAYNAASESWQGDMHHVASVPLIVMEQWLKEGVNILEDAEALRRKLNDPDNKFLRTRPGKI